MNAIKHSKPQPRRLSAWFTILLALTLHPTMLHADGTDDAINQLIDGLHEDAGSANFSNYFSRFAPDAVFLGTDRHERWSIEDFKAYAKPHFDAGRGWRYEVRERYLAGSGDTRWFDEVLWNEKYGHCRGTGVVTKTPQGWLISHYSLAFLIPNESAADVGVITKAFDAQP